MTDRQREIIERAGLDPAEFAPAEFTVQEIAEDAYLQAQYNSILIELLMEE